MSLMGSMGAWPDRWVSVSDLARRALGCGGKSEHMRIVLAVNVKIIYAMYRLGVFDLVFSFILGP